MSNEVLSPPSDVVALLAGPRTLQDVFENWPDQIGVAILGMGENVSHLILYHEDETAMVMGRIVQISGTSEDRILLAATEERSGSPEVAAPFRLRFSQERDMIAAIADLSMLPEIANDYRINFEFSRDEKLPLDSGDPNADPAWLIDIAPTKKEDDPLDVPAPAVQERASETPEYEETDEEADNIDDLIPFDLPSDRKVIERCHILSGNLSLIGEAVVLSIGEEGPFKNIQKGSGSVLSFRDDLGAFMLAPRSLAGWKPGTPVKLYLQASSFPRDILDLCRKSTVPVRIASTPWGVRVSTHEDPGKISVQRRVLYLGAALIALSLGLSVVSLTMVLSGAS